MHSPLFPLKSNGQRARVVGNLEPHRELSGYARVLRRPFAECTRRMHRMLHAEATEVAPCARKISKDPKSLPSSSAVDVGKAGLRLSVPGDVQQQPVAHPLPSSQGTKTNGIEKAPSSSIKGRPPNAGMRRNEARYKRAQSKKFKQTTKGNKITTGKYDMFVLRELARTEEAALKELVAMYKVESEDDLPVTFDIHELVDMDQDERRTHLTAVLRECPSAGVEAFKEKYLDRIDELNPHL